MNGPLDNYSRGMARVAGQAAISTIFRISFFQLEGADSSTQLPELLTLFTGEAILATALVQAGLAQPVAQRLRGHAELSAQLLRPTAGTEQTDRLSPELRWVRRIGLA